jgi:ATP-dependent RNA helicase DeaD
MTKLVTEDPMEEPEAVETTVSEPEPAEIEPRVAFSEMNLIPPLLEAVHRTGYTHASPIQAQLIPIAMEGHDCIGKAQTGTGKTAAFLLPFMNRWRGGDLTRPQAIIVTPTRELAEQIYVEAKKLSPSKYFRSVCVYGGARFGKQIEELRKGCTLLVGTPGRLLDHLQRGTLDLSGIKYVVMDEADRMLDQGFRPQIERILRRLPEKRQTLLMSATLSDSIMKLTSRYQHDPKIINVSPAVMTVDKIDQRYITVDPEKKFDLLNEVMKHETIRQCIIFVERKRGADTLYKGLHKLHAGVHVIHGDLPQPKRNRIMAAFRDGKIPTLIATDVMSRGIDVQGISHIINYDLPIDIDNYVHRIGRTGRMGKDGISISFVTPDQGKILTEIETLINKMIPSYKIEGFEAFTPKKKEEGPVEEKKITPVYGRHSRRYSNRL